jgi:hypothetical protein
MNRPAHIVTLIATAALLASSALHAADTPEPPAQATMEQLKSRLNLTPEQEAKIAPLAEQRRTQMEAVRTKMQSAASRREKGNAMREAKQIQDEYVKAVEPLLTSDQKAEWKKIRDESKAELKERWRNRQ